MIYLVKDTKETTKVETKDGRVVSDCRWRGYETIELIMMCMVFNYEIKLTR